MARKQKKVLTEEELIKEKLKQEWSFIADDIHLIPEPTYLFEVGESVYIGSLKNCIIKEVLMDGKVYLIEYTNVDNNYGKPIETPNSLRYVKWLSVSQRNNNINPNHFSKKDDLRINFSQMTIQSLFTKVYSFGVNFDPEYQRGYVWNLEDKIALIDSIFSNVEIGKFAFIKYDDKKWSETKLSYEVLDGKQRLSTLCEFYEGRFEFNGYKFKELSPKDRNHILSYPVSIAEIGHATEQQILQYFIKLNSYGKVMDQEHLNNVRKML